MRYTSYNKRSYYSSFFPPGVKWLLITNVAVFLINFFAMVLTETDPFRLFGLVPIQVVRLGFLWQLATYMFLHGGIGHILFNMLALWMFGVDLERDWGTRKFLQYYFLCGIGAGVCVIVASYVLGGPTDPLSRTIGSSGAIYGLLLAFGMLYPDRIVLMSFLFPIKAKYFVIIMGAIAFLSSFRVNTGVSDVAHLGGMIFGFLYLKTQLRRTGPNRLRISNPFSTFRERIKEWRRQRARKRFQVYMRKHRSDQDRWVN